ncbi:MAG: Cell division protein FtsA [Patescibacteria group bacterium]|nr:Cell division protein FtsA [Patescibacteria group bacterium]
MIRNIAVGIDIGSSTTKIVVGEFIKGEKNPKIIGVGESETKGMRHGYVISSNETLSSLKSAIDIAEKNSKIKIKRAIISISGVTLRGDITSSNVVISKADGEVTVLDINKAIDECENNVGLGNKKILQVFPVAFKLDSKEVLGNPEGMHGNKLEVKSLVITCLNKHFEDLLEVITDAGITPVDIIVAPIAASSIALSKKQKIVGSLLVNIGAETTSMVVYENGEPISLHTFSIGSSDVTNDIALGFKINLEEAENLKLGNVDPSYSKKKLDEIIEARFGDIFELIENHLRKIKRSELLPAGVIFIGGGANTLRIEEMSKSFLKLPSKVGTTDIFGNIKTKLRDPSWFTVLGLLYHNKESEIYSDSSFSNVFKDIKNAIKQGIKQLKP